VKVGSGATSSALCALEWPTEREAFRADLDELPLRDNCEGSRRKASRANPNNNEGHRQPNAHRTAKHDQDISKQTVS
jgi:hypothetical protein